MKREFWVAGLMWSGVASLALAEQSERELGAHEHGHSALNVAIEGDRVEMELIAPGADIVGFEHAAESEEDKAALEQAEVTLGEPLSLFGFADAAGCSVESASVEIEGEEHDAEGEHAEADHEEHQGEAAHNEFHAAYALTCNNPDVLDVIDFTAFFEAFTGSEEVEVTVISEKGQSSYEVERDAPVVDLQGVM
ncbi:MAG: DUF2796 domain-containing protein [Geminicoccaceae bacterium]